jgi:16S rRNA processing protein RimM
VRDSGDEVGTIVDVIWGAGDAPLLRVKAPGGREHRIPFASAFVVRMDLEHKRLEMALPEGLLELDAPPCEDEKP